MTCEAWKLSGGESTKTNLTYAENVGRSVQSRNCSTDDPVKCYCNPPKENAPNKHTRPHIPVERGRGVVSLCAHHQKIFGLTPA